MYEYMEIQTIAIRNVSTKEFAQASFRQSKKKKKDDEPYLNSEKELNDSNENQYLANNLPGIVKAERVYNGYINAHLNFAHIPAVGSGLALGSWNFLGSSSPCFFIELPNSTFSVGVRGISTSPCVPNWSKSEDLNLSSQK